MSYTVQTGLPSVMMVVASLGSLFVPAEQVPGRMTLSITTCLTLVAMSGSVFQNSPRTAYLKVDAVTYITMTV